MQLNIIRKTLPGSSEHAPFYSRYTSLAGDADILETLERQAPETVSLLAGLPDLQAGFRYAPGKWSIKEVLGHLTDTERIMSYRALRFARNDQTAIEGFEQDDYVRGAEFDNRGLVDILEEFTSVRRATILLFEHLSPEAWLRHGIASQNPVSVRALAYIIAGHEIHHRNVLKEKYLSR